MTHLTAVNCKAWRLNHVPYAAVARLLFSPEPVQAVLVTAPKILFFESPQFGGTTAEGMREGGKKVSGGRMSFQLTA